MTSATTPTTSRTRRRSRIGRLLLLGFGALMLVDGAVSAAAGKSVLVFGRGVLPGPSSRLLRVFEVMPPWLFRGGAVLQAFLGLRILRRALSRPV
jgi:hypothetical protein